MTSYQDIEPRIKVATEKSRDLAFMNREQIFDLISELVVITDDLNNYARDLDQKISEAEVKAYEMAASNKMNASLTALAVKQAIAPFKADKEWASKQGSLLSDIRIAALAAQRGAE